jgi:hypothetical protein
MGTDGVNSMSFFIQNQYGLIAEKRSVQANFNLHPGKRLLQDPYIVTLERLAMITPSPFKSALPRLISFI